VTTLQIEVRAVAGQQDARARRLARDIIHLPPGQFPSLVSITASQQPLFLRSAQLYHLTPLLESPQIDQLISNLLVDPVVQEAVISEKTTENEHYIVDVFFHPGVTDTLAESVIIGASMLGITGLEHVETGTRYRFDGRLSEAEVRAITKALLYNPVIQRYVLHTPDYRTDIGAEADMAAQFIAPGASDTGNDKTGAMNCAATSTPDPVFTPTYIPISDMTDEQLLALSKRGMLALNLDELHAIQHYYRAQGREPTDVELETLAQTWSEHCSHKTFKATIRYREVDEQDQTVATETIDGLLKQYLMRATETVRPPWLVSAFSDNAGIIRFTETHDVAFKVETHNHPSAIEPFGGANTGVGGVIRDVLGVSAWPIACTDILCFGPPDTPSENLPAGVLSPRRIADGVVNGVRDYGNKMGVPTVNGAILYDEGYISNPLVFCGCIGLLPHGSHPRDAQSGDQIVVLGGRTGRDGIHGATFSSGEMSSAINAQAGSAVQIGAPITEKKVADVIVQARDRGLYHAITDCGAGGFSSAIGEMGAETGVFVELEKAPLKYQGLAPWEIWLSEAQERMVLAVPPQHLDELVELCAIEEVEASIIGVFTDTHRLVVTYHDATVSDLDMAFLHDGRPDRILDAVWTRHPERWPTIPSSGTATYQRDDRGPTHYAPTLLALLRHPTIASKEAVVRRYDHEVQGATVLKPLVGKNSDGPGDATVLRPILDASSTAGIVIANGINPLYGAFDPYHMALNAVDEALRNLTAVGGDIAHAAILDNFCWGNPDDPAQLGMLVRAVKGCHDAAVGFGVPFISGKDSLNNEYRDGDTRLPVIPTLLVSAIGVIDDAARTVDMSFKAPGNLLYLVGMASEEMAGSHYAEVVGREVFEQFFPYAVAPKVNISRAYDLMKAVGAAIRQGLVCSCHDLSEGGLAVALAEMAIAGGLGARVNLGMAPPQDLQRNVWNIVRLFSESPSRFIVEVTPDNWQAFEQHMHANRIDEMKHIGNVTDSGYLDIFDRDELIYLPIVQLQEAWKGDQA
jgi:phosphoribosylformylglycinamidine synthase subunit PurSL